MDFKACLPVTLLTRRKHWKGSNRERPAAWGMTDNREELATGVLEFIPFSHKAVLAENIFRLFERVASPVSGQ